MGDKCLASSAVVVTNNINSITDGLEQLLVDVVRRHPILYDRSHKFHNRIAHPAAHEETWRVISAVMRLEESSCKSLWSCVKQKFIKHRKRIATGETVGTKDWPIYDSMHSWLNEHICTRRYVNKIENIFCIELNSNLCLNPLWAQRHSTRMELCKQIRSGVNGGSNTLHGDECYNETILTTSIVDDTNVWNELPEENPVKTTTTTTTSATTFLPLIKIGPRQYVTSSKHNNSTVAASKPIAVASQLGKRKAVAIMAASPMPSTSAPNTINKTTAHQQQEAIINYAPKVPTTAIANTRQIHIESVKKEANTTATDNSAASTDDAPDQKDTTTVNCGQSGNAGAHNIDFSGLERAIGQCINLADQCSKRQRCQDPDEVFGTLIASMVRELPVDRRRGARVQILELVSEVLTKMDDRTS